MRHEGIRHLLLGLGIAGLGVVVSLGTYEAASQNGGGYAILWGLVVYGLYRAFIGVRIILAASQYPSGPVLRPKDLDRHIGSAEPGSPGRPVDGSGSPLQDRLPKVTCSRCRAVVNLGNSCDRCGHSFLPPIHSHNRPNERSEGSNR